MVHRLVIALVWLIAVIVGVAIATLSHSFSIPANPGGLTSSRQLILVAALVVLALLAVIVLWWNGRRPAQ